MHCNGEVLPESLGFSRDLADSIAVWMNIHDSLYKLWLDSEDYESWAKAQLMDLSGRVNCLGRQSQAELQNIRRCYYTLFKDLGNPELASSLNCPACQKQLQEYSLSKLPGAWLTCEDCLLVMQAD